MDIRELSPAGQQPTFTALRQRAGLKQAVVAQRSNLSPQTIWRIEHGHSVSIETVNAALNVVNEVLGTTFDARQIAGVRLSNT